MTSFADLVSLARTRVGYPAPETGGDDFFSDKTIQEYLNNAFDQMAFQIGGFPAYVEFTVSTAWVIAVTKPVSSPPTIDIQNPQVASQNRYKVSNLLSYEKFENLTSPLNTTDERMMRHISVYDPVYQSTFNSSSGGNYLNYYSLDQEKGFTLLPVTIGVANTIGITYRKGFTRNTVGSVTFAGTGLNDLTIEGSYTGASNISFVVKIVTGGSTSPNTFTLSIDGGVSYSGTYNLSTTGTSIGYGLSVKAAALINHVANDTFSFSATAGSLSLFNELEMRKFPVTAAAHQMALDLRDQRLADALFIKAYGTRWLNEAIAGGELLEFLEGRTRSDRIGDVRLQDEYPQGDVGL